MCWLRPPVTWQPTLPPCVPRDRPTISPFASLEVRSSTKIEQPRLPESLAFVRWAHTVSLQVFVFLRPTIARLAGILNLARQRVFARTPWRSPVPLATYSLLRAAYLRVLVLDGVPPAPALVRPAGSPSLLFRFAGHGPGGSSGVLPACEDHPSHLRVPGASRQIVPGTLLQCPGLTTRQIPVRLQLVSGSSTDRSAGLVRLLSLRSRDSSGDYAGEPRGSAPPLGGCKSPLLASFVLYSRVYRATGPIPRACIQTDLLSTRPTLPSAPLTGRTRLFARARVTPTLAGIARSPGRASPRLRRGSPARMLSDEQSRSARVPWLRASCRSGGGRNPRRPGGCPGRGIGHALAPASRPLRDTRGTRRTRPC